MKQSIGSVTLINIIIVFLVVIFGLLAATMSYAKAYKINSRIMNGIEIFEGFNDKALSYIDKALENFGYAKGTPNCPQTKKINGKTGTLVTSPVSSYYFCVYKFSESVEGKCYYSYGIVTYIIFDLPIVGRFDLPVTSKTNRVFNFDKYGGSEC